MTAKAVVNRLIEAGPDDVDPNEEIDRYMGTKPFDDGIADITHEARQLYQRLVAAHVIRPDSTGDYATIAGAEGFDSSAMAQAVMQLAIERRDALGTEKAYKLIRRHGHSVI